MMVLPLRVSDTEMDIAIVLEDENIERIKDADPAEVVRHQMGPYSGITIRNIVITYASPEDLKKIQPLVSKGDIAAILRYLSRNFKYRPDRGDHDEDYEITRGTVH